MSRESMLKRIRAQKIQALPYPEEQVDAQTFEDVAGHFAEVLELVGGECRTMAPGQSVADALAGDERYTGKVVNLVEGGPESTLDLATIAGPHDLADVNLAIIRGEFGVAENAAIWVPEPLMGARALPFITQHLVIVIPAASLVHTMHQAYERVSADGLGFGVFISGPSKTADIEQSLVVGAHGARSLTVLLEG